MRFNSERQSMTGSTKTEEDESLYTVATNDDLLSMLSSINETLKIIARSMGHTELTPNKGNIK